MAQDEPASATSPDGALPSPLLLFDGVCNLCNSSVTFILRHDRRGRFRFASLQSAAGQAVLTRYGLPTAGFESVVLLEDGRLYQRSTAALRVARLLDPPWPLFYAFILIPRLLRDLVYDLIARNRYRVFGKRESCMLPTPALRSRFLGE